jgi:hypothetical protein
LRNVAIRGTSVENARDGSLFSVSSAAQQACSFDLLKGRR